MNSLSEADIEQISLNELSAINWQVEHDPEIALETLAAEHGVFDMASFSHREAWLAKQHARPFGVYKGWSPTGFSRRAPAALSTSGG